METVSSSKLVLTRRMVIGNITALFSGSVVAQGLTALTLLLTARQLGPGGYGQYTGSFALVSFTGILFNLGLDVWLLREGGRDPERLKDNAGSVLALKVGLGLIFVALWWVLAGGVRISTFPPDLLRLSALTVLFDRLFLTLMTVFKAALKNRMTSTLDILSDGIWFVGTLILIQLGQEAVASFFWVRIGALVVMFGVALWIAFRVVKLSARWEVMRGAFRGAFPYASSEFLTWIYMRFDVLIIGFALGEQAVGLYSPAVSLVNALFLIPAAVHAVFIPILSNLFVHHPLQAWKTAWRSVALLAGIGLVLTGGLFFGAEILVGFLGTRYAASGEILKILSLILWVHSLAFGMGAMLVALNLQGRRSVVQAVAVVVNIGLNMWIVRWLEIPGVAWVYVLTEVVLLIGYVGIVGNQYQKWRTSMQGAG
ncbi:MAG: lipopolysaccharide biosynthesis protein [Anaerolineales bacterium]